MSKEAIRSFEDFCIEHNLRITPPRLNAYRIVYEATKPITAYEVLEELGKTTKSPKPPTAYRALDFLSEHGFIHRIESLNAYVSCHEQHQHRGSQFMICDTCGHVEEIHLCSLPETLEKKVKSEKFNMKYWNVEIHGQCTDCK